MPVLSLERRLDSKSLAAFAMRRVRRGDKSTGDLLFEPSSIKLANYGIAVPRGWL
jgi:hypothetical protein